MQHFSERQKQAIELSGEAEHAHGSRREALIRKAQEADGAKSRQTQR